jgi:hypothetical protein
METDILTGGVLRGRYPGSRVVVFVHPPAAIDGRFHIPGLWMLLRRVVRVLGDMIGWVIWLRGLEPVVERDIVSSLVMSWHSPVWNVEEDQYFFQLHK